MDEHKLIYRRGTLVHSKLGFKAVLDEDVYADEWDDNSFCHIYLEKTTPHFDIINIPNIVLFDINRFDANDLEEDEEA